MNYAIKTPDGEAIFKVIIDGTLPLNKTLQELDLWEVVYEIPSGSVQDYGSGSPRGWYLDGDVVRPCIKDMETPSTVPASVTPWQIRRALNAAGLRTIVESAVASGSQDVKDAWEFASEIRRDNALLNDMANALGMTSSQVDDLFILANSYNN